MRTNEKINKQRTERKNRKTVYNVLSSGFNILKPIILIVFLTGLRAVFFLSGLFLIALVITSDNVIFTMFNLLFIAFSLWMCDRCTVKINKIKRIRKRSRQEQERRDIYR